MVALLLVLCSLLLLLLLFLLLIVIFVVAVYQIDAFFFYFGVQVCMVFFFSSRLWSCFNTVDDSYIKLQIEEEEETALCHANFVELQNIYFVSTELLFQNKSE